MKRLLLFVSILASACESAAPDPGISGDYEGVLLGEGLSFLGGEFDAQAQVGVKLVQTDHRIKGVGWINGLLRSGERTQHWVRNITISGVETTDGDDRYVLYSLEVSDGCDTFHLRGSTWEDTYASGSQRSFRIRGKIAPTLSRFFPLSGG